MTIIVRNELVSFLFVIKNNSRSHCERLFALAIQLLIRIELFDESVEAILLECLVVEYDIHCFSLTVEK